MFEEEKEVAEKAPVDGIMINDLNIKKVKNNKAKKKKFSYNIKVADFYYKKTAIMMQKRIIELKKSYEVKINKLLENWNATYAFIEIKLKK